MCIVNTTVQTRVTLNLSRNSREQSNLLWYLYHSHLVFLFESVLSTDKRFKVLIPDGSVLWCFPAPTCSLIFHTKITRSVREAAEHPLCLKPAACVYRCLSSWYCKQCQRHTQTRRCHVNRPERPPKPQTIQLSYFYNVPRMDLSSQDTTRPEKKTFSQSSQSRMFISMPYTL